MLNITDLNSLCWIFVGCSLILHSSMLVDLTTKQSLIDLTTCVIADEAVCVGNLLLIIIASNSRGLQPSNVQFTIVFA